MSIEFNGSTSKLQWNGGPSLSYPITIFAWLKPDSASTNGMAVGFGDSPGGNEIDLYVEGTTNKVKAFSSGTLTAAADSTTAPQTSWQPAMAVFTSTTSRTIYYAGGAAVTDTTSNTVNLASFNRLVVGTRGRTDSIYFDGLIAEVAVWSGGTALGSTEFTSLSGGAFPETVATGTLWEHWKLEDASDLVGTVSRTLTATSATNGATHPFSRSGGLTRNPHRMLNLIGIG